MLLKSPSFTIVAVLTLALGIGANVATFSVVYAVLLRPLSFLHPEQLVRVFDDLRGSNDLDVGMSVPELWDLQDRSGVFQDISAVAPGSSAVGGGERTVRAESLVTSPDYFALLGAKPQLGRVYTPQDAVPGFLEPVVISDGFWRRNFASDPNIVGRKMRLDSDMYTIVGVMPPRFRHPGPTLNTDIEVWVATGFNALPFPIPAVNDSGRNWALEAWSDCCPSPSAPRCLYIATQPRVSGRIPRCRYLDCTPCSLERRPGGSAADGIVHPLRRRRICAAYRVREHYEPSSRALFRTVARDPFG
jgi:hypothetical protein